MNHHAAIPFLIAIKLPVSESSSNGDLRHLQSLYLRQDFRLAAHRELVNSPFPSTDILCQIKNWIGINDGRGLDNSEWVLKYEMTERFPAQIGGINGSQLRFGLD
jgi:hypothetical protein